MSKGWQFIITLACLAFVGAIIATTYTIVQYGQLAENTQSDLIAACEKNRAPLHDYFQGELASTRTTDPSLFPDIPPEVFAQLLSVKIDRLKAVIETFDPAGCAEQYE